MQNLLNVVRFHELCVFAVDSGLIADYNTASIILYVDCHPFPDEVFKDIHISDLEHIKYSKPREVVKRFLEKENVAFISVTK